MHFEMEPLQNVLELIRPGVYMTAINLKDAFYSIPAHKNHQAYLTFFVEEYLKFVCMPNGYRPALRIFKKTSFLSVNKKVSYLYFKLMTHICKAVITRIASLMF